MAVGTSSTHTMLYRVVGASNVVSSNRQIARSFNAVQGSAGAFLRGLNGLKSSIIATYGVFAGLGFGIISVVRQYEKFSEAQAKLRVIVASSIPNVQRGTQQVSDLALGVARDLGYSSTEATLAMSSLMETGIGAHKAMAIFRTGMELARIGAMRAEDATEFLSDTLNLFRREQAQTGESTQVFARRMGQMLVIAAQRAATDIPQLRYAFRYAATEMATFGYRSDEVMASLAGLSTIGIRGSSAGTRLRGAITALHRVTPRTQQVFAQWGVTSEELNQVLYDQEGRLLPLAQGMQNLYALLGRLPTQQARNAASMYLFGQRASAAGLSLGRLTAAGSRTLEILQDLRGNLEEDWTRMLRTRLEGFDIQMRQLREGARDLAITFGMELFGATNRAGEGFGTYTRRLSEAVLLADPANRQTAEARRRWAALGPELQAQGRELRGFFQDAAKVLRDVATVLVAIARFARNHPYITTALLAIKATVGWGNSILWTIGLLTRYFAAISSASAMTRAFALTATYSFATAVGVIGIFLAAGNLLTRAIEKATSTYGDFHVAIGQSERTVATMIDDFLRGIPIIGNFLSQFVRLYQTMIAVYEFAWGAQSATARRRRTGEERRAAWQEGGAVGIARERARRMGVTGETGVRRAAAMERQTEMQRLAEALYAQGIQNQAGIQEAIRQAGAPAAHVSRYTSELLQLQRAQGGDAMRLAGEAVLGEYAGGMREALRDTSTRIRDFERVVQRGTAPVLVGTGAPEGELVPVPRTPIVVGSSPSVTVTPQQRAATTNVQAQFTVPVTVNIDGEEVSRSVGRQQVQQMQRGGATFAPGVRRTLRETGVPVRAG